MRLPLRGFIAAAIVAVSVTRSQAAPVPATQRSAIAVLQESGTRNLDNDLIDASDQEHLLEARVNLPGAGSIEKTLDQLAGDAEDVGGASTLLDWPPSDASLIGMTDDQFRKYRIDLSAKRRTNTLTGHEVDGERLEHVKRERQWRKSVLHYPSTVRLALNQYDLVNQVKRMKGNQDASTSIAKTASGSSEGGSAGFQAAAEEHAVAWPAHASSTPSYSTHSSSNTHASSSSSSSAHPHSDLNPLSPGTTDLLYSGWDETLFDDIPMAHFHSTSSSAPRSAHASSQPSQTPSDPQPQHRQPEKAAGMALRPLLLPNPLSVGLAQQRLSNVARKARHPSSLPLHETSTRAQAVTVDDVLAQLERSAKRRRNEQEGIEATRAKSLVQSWQQHGNVATPPTRSSSSGNVPLVNAASGHQPNVAMQRALAPQQGDQVRQDAAHVAMAQRSVPLVAPSAHLTSSSDAAKASQSEWYRDFNRFKTDPSAEELRSMPDKDFVNYGRRLNYRLDLDSMMDTGIKLAEFKVIRRERRKLARLADSPQGAQPAAQPRSSVKPILTPGSNMQRQARLLKSGPSSMDPPRVPTSLFDNAAAVQKEPAVKASMHRPSTGTDSRLHPAQSSARRSTVRLDSVPTIYLPGSENLPKPWLGSDGSRNLFNQPRVVQPALLRHQGVAPQATPPPSLTPREDRPNKWSDRANRNSIER